MPWGSAWYRGVKVDRYRFRGLKHFLVTLVLPGWPFQSNSGWFRVMLLAGPDRGYLTAYVLEYLDHGTPTIQGPLQLYSYARDVDHWQCGLSPIELTERVPESTLHYKFTHLLSRAAEYMRTVGLSTLGSPGGPYSCFRGTLV